MLRGVGGICVLELRSTRRMARTWLFALLALTAGGVLYHGFGFNHFYNDSIAPRFAVPGFGVATLWVLLIGLVFIGVDARHRDGGAQVGEALDTRPVSNVALLAGRLLAVVLVVWLPLLVLALGLQVAGMVVARYHLPGGIPPEPVALLTFVLLDAPVAFALWGAVLAVLVAVLRSRWAAAGVAVALLGLCLVAIFNTPLYLLPSLSGITNLGLPGSEILPRWPSAVDWAARAATVVCCAGLLVVAAGVWPRLDSVPAGKRLLLGGALVGVGATAIAALAWQAHAKQAERDAWTQTHRALRDAPRLDIERIAGQVFIEPGQRLEIRVEVAARAPTDTAMDALRFSLNPAMTVRAVRVDGVKARHSHDQGLLDVTPARPLPPNARVVVAINATGVPDQRFGYLDSAVDAMTETLLGSPMVLLGEQASLFDRNFVALMPSVRWLPAAGANFAAPPDFHELDLAVEVPPGWHAAGAGRRRSAHRLRFEPTVPIPEFALLAAPLARHAMTVDEVECELLIHPKHQGNVEYFTARASEATGEDGGITMTINVTDGGDYRAERHMLGSGGTLVDKLRDRLRRWLSGDQLPAYPHRVISLVEVPAPLRRYGGGWLMDTVQALPGIQLLAEHGLPTSRLTERPRWSGFSQARWLNHLYAQVEHSGAHRVGLTAGAARNLVPFLTRADGDGAAAIDYLVEWLTAWRMRGSRAVAPAHWLRVSLSPRMPFLVRVLERGMASATMTSSWFRFFPMAHEDESEKVSFTGFDPATRDNGADIVVHKGNLIGLSIQRLLGAEKVSRFLALLRERHAGGTFAKDDFVQAMVDVEPAMASFLAHVLDEPALPGFLASDARVARLPDDESGNPRYQIRVHVRNDELAPGVAGLSYRADDSAFFQWSPFAHVPGKRAVEIGMVSRQPPVEVRLETYLSLNRRIMRLRLPSVNVQTIVDEPSLVGARASAWRPPDIGIVVDDLDAGFAATSPPTGWGLRAENVVDDEALPEFRRDSGVTPRWRRQTDENAVIWGKYRRTLVRIAAGKGQGKARFTTELPVAGRWRLYYHLPGASLSEGHYMRSKNWWHRADAFGDMDIVIAVGEHGSGGGERLEVNFNAAQATPGWNRLGSYDLPAGRVQVIVSDATDGDIVVADAVRWQRAE